MSTLHESAAAVRHRNRAEDIALVCDYLRSRANPEDYINDEIGIAQMGVPAEVQTLKANRMLDTIEAMNFAELVEMLAGHLVDAYLSKAMEWRDEQRAAQRRGNFR